jgi:hypothetical protein
MNLFSGRKMGGSSRSINSFFRWAGLLLLATGCTTTPAEKQAKQEAKDLSAVRLFTEVRDESMSGSQVSLPRSNPVEIKIEKEPFADERDIARADVVNAVGGFSIRLELTSHGRMALEQASVTHAGLRLVAFGQWTAGKEETVQRWLAAPVMRSALRAGVVVFTPDLSREEADRLVRGLNNVAIKLENQPKPKKAKETEADRKKTDRQKKKEESKKDKPSAAEDTIKEFEKRGQ